MVQVGAVILLCLLGSVSLIQARTAGEKSEHTGSTATGGTNVIMIAGPFFPWFMNPSFALPDWAGMMGPSDNNMGDLDDSGPSFDEIANMKPGNKNTHFLAEADHQSSSFEEVDGKVVKDNTSGEAIVNDNGHVNRTKLN